MKIVVYTAITGGYEKLKDEQIKGNAEFICFTDTDIKSDTWEIRKACDLFTSPVRNAKIHKVLPHKYLDCDCSIWIDGSISLVVDPEYLVKKYLQDKDIAVYIHRDKRNCIYKEADICIQKRLDSIGLIDAQVASYRNSGYPEDNGLYECTVILRKHTNKIEEFNNAWWAEICRYSKRDQLSFTYIADKLKLAVCAPEGRIVDSRYFKMYYHNGNSLSKPIVKPKVPIVKAGFTRIILNKDKNLHPNKYKKDDVIDVPRNIAQRWINRGIAHYDTLKINSLKKFDWNDFKYTKHPKVSITIPVKDSLDYTKKCLDSLVEYTKNYELIIIDNGSEDETKRFLRQKQRELNFTLIVNKENMGFPYACDQGIKVATCKYLCFLNSDTMVSPNWLGKLVKGFRWKEYIGIVGPSTCYSGSEQMIKELAYKRFKMTQDDINTVSISLEEGYQKLYPLGFCYLIKKEVIDKIGVFDYKRYGLGSSEETDLSWRACKMGYRGCWVKNSYVHHFGHTTFISLGLDVMKERNKKTKIFYERKNDPKRYIENDVVIDKIYKPKKKTKK